MQDILIVGAGVAGLTAAQQLSNAGRDVLVFEKSRGLGGRSATRTVNHFNVHPVKVDHGAQYFTVRDERFQSQVDTWLEQGYVKIWSHGFHRLTKEGLESPTQGHPRYIFPEGMNTLGKCLGEGLNIRTEVNVSSITQREDTWLVSSNTGETFQAKTVILNMPAEQALELYPFDVGNAADNLKVQLEKVIMEPSFALMLGYDSSLAPGWQGILIETSEAVSWLSHDSSKRTSRDETVIVVHSTPDFARQHFDEPPETVKHYLLTTLSTLNLQPSIFNQTPLWSELHRWKYALPHQHLNVKFLQRDSLYICGDWCGGARLEAAYLSGLELGKQLV
ncbi:MAG: NAD(P)/FAD-dependent oxidoreductase [Trueperaceae bacterium]